jgi:predicted alpha/beta-fold hydrolase
LKPESFRPAWWLPGRHLQTLWGQVRSRRAVPFRRERLETPDGDEILLDHAGPASGMAPRVLVIHGLEGSSYSGYVQGLLARVVRMGWGGTALNFRSCARDPVRLSRTLSNRRPRLYHSGETADLDLVVSRLSAAQRGAPLGAIGVSLGANVLLKWLGEQTDAPTTALAAAATISSPYDLAASARHLESGFGRLYTRNLLATMRRKAFEVAARFPEAAARIDGRGARAARTFFAFDDAATAPLHGFLDAADYYRRSSSLPFLATIRTPTLCVSAEDDPFVPAESVRRARAAASAAVEFVMTRRGGHVGWVSGPTPWRARYWAEEIVVKWLQSRL